MKITMTMQQFARLARLSEQDWRALLSFLRKEAGKGEYTPDLENLKTLSLVAKVCGNAYAKFEIDGEVPAHVTPQVGKKRSVNESNAFFTWFNIAYRERFKIHYASDPGDFGLMQKLAMYYDRDGFREFLKEYIKNSVANTSIRGLWAWHKSGFIKCRKRVTAGRRDETVGVDE